MWFASRHVIGAEDRAVVKQPTEPSQAERELGLGSLALGGDADRDPRGLDSRDWSGVSGPKNTSRAGADVFTRQVRSPARWTASSARGDEAWSARRRWRGNGGGGGDERHRPGRCAQRAGATNSSVLLLSGSNGDGK
jgi:hypothetical protein